MVSADVHIQIHVYVYIYICMHTCTHTCYVCMSTCIHIHMYYIHTTQYIYIYIHTHTYIPGVWPKICGARRDLQIPKRGPGKSDGPLTLPCSLQLIFMEPHTIHQPKQGSNKLRTTLNQALFGPCLAGVVLNCMTSTFPRQDLVFPKQAPIGGSAAFWSSGRGVLPLLSPEFSIEAPAHHLESRRALPD